MNATLKIDPQSEAKFREALGKIVFMAGKEKIRLMMEQMVLLLRDAMKLTPPMGDAPITETLDVQRAIGERAIKRDLLGGRDGAWTDPKAGIFTALKQSFIESAEFGKVDDTVKLWVTKSGDVYGVEKSLYRPNASFSEMREHHKKHRRKDGRVTSAGAHTRNIGRWKFANRMVVSKETFGWYIKDVFARVFTAKSGWVYAWDKFLVALQRTTKKGTSRGIPKELKLMRGAGAGHYINAGTTDRPVMEGGNSIPFAQRFAGHVMGRAWSNRVRNIQKQAKVMERELAKSLKQEGIEARANA